MASLTSPPRCIVSVVVDPAFPEAQLRDLAARMPVWIADTPANRGAADRCRVSDPNANSIERGVTTFRIDVSASPAEWCVSILDSIDDHHGEYSHDPPYDALDVYGTPVTDALSAALVEHGLTVIEPSSDDRFRARSRPAS